MAREISHQINSPIFPPVILGGMDTGENIPGLNMRRLRKAKAPRMSQEALAEKAGVTQPQISMWEKRERPLNDLAIIRRIASALEVDPAEIIGESVIGGRRTVPVVAFVGAGAEVNSIDDHVKGAGLDEVECPPGMNPEKTIAVRVLGDSMEPMVVDGDILYYDERVYGVPEEYFGKICVVKVVDGPTYVKRIKRGNGIGRYHLISLNPADPEKQNMAVEWSAKVKFFGQS